MEKHEKTKADQYDHNDYLPKDILNKEQDPNSFRDPLEQQLEKKPATRRLKAIIEIKQKKNSGYSTSKRLKYLSEIVF